MNAIDEILKSPHWLCRPPNDTVNDDLQKRFIIKILKSQSDSTWVLYAENLRRDVTQCIECSLKYRQLVNTFEGNLLQQSLEYDKLRIKLILQQQKSLIEDPPSALAFMEVLNQPLLSITLSQSVSRHLQVVMAQTSKLFIPVIRDRKLPLGFIWFRSSSNSNLSSWSRQAVAYMKKKNMVDVIDMSQGRCLYDILRVIVEHFCDVRIEPDLTSKLDQSQLNDVLSMMSEELCHFMFQHALSFKKHSLQFLVLLMNGYVELKLQVNSKCMDMLRDLIAGDKTGMKPLVAPLSMLLKSQPSKPIQVMRAPQVHEKPRSEAFKQIKNDAQREAIVRQQPMKKRQQASAPEANTIDKIQQDVSQKPQRQVRVLDTSLPSRIYMPTDQGSSVQSEIVRTVDEFVHDMLTWNLYELSDANNTLRKVPDTFRSVKHYVDHMESLSILEYKAQLIGCRDSVRHDDFKVMAVQMIQSVDSHHEITFDVEAQECTENDVILLVDEPDVKQVLKVLRQQLKHQTMALVLGVVRHKGGMQQLRCKIVFAGRNINSLGLFRLKTKWSFAKVTGFNTTARELCALYNIKQLPLRLKILNPIQEDQKQIESYRVDNISRHCDVNEPQAYAIAAALDSTGFTLIQGPPGAGKSKTIVGLVGEYLTQSMVTVKKPHILVCAPSNAAVDELVRRFRQGIYYLNLKKYKPAIVRLGTLDGTHESVKDVTLDSLVEAKVAESANLPDMSNSGQLEYLRTKLRETRATLDNLYNQLDALETPGKHDNIQNKIKDAYATKQSLMDQINVEYTKRDTGVKALDILRKKLRTQILNDAQIVCCTLSSSGHEVFKLLQTPFDTVVVDEACQSVEVSSLIPLQYGAIRCVLVGDPNQLPPTVLSSSAQSMGYDQSLFVRLQKSQQKNVHLLSIQYRMHPEISQFPSKMFYAGKLKDGPGMLELNTAEWHSKFAPYMFYDVSSEESRVGKSLHNEAECDALMDQFSKLMEFFPNYSFAGQIGIISPYKEQKNRLIQMFQSKYGPGILQLVDINTIDGFQGQEKQIILFSCVRSNLQGQIGFLQDVRRLNVALTRAKSSLWIFGNTSSLSSSNFWSALIQDAKDRGCYTEDKRLKSRKRKQPA